MYKIRPIATTVVLTLVVLLLVGIHSVPAFAYSRQKQPDSDTTTVAQPADPTSTSSSSSDPSSTTDSTDPSTSTVTTPTTTDTDPSASTTSDPTDSTDPSSTDPVSSDATINSQTDSSSQSGDAAVTDNGTAGDATSGDTQTDANIINSVNSSSSLDGGNLETFDDNVNGNVSGNIVIDPTQLSEPASTSSDPNNVEFDSTNTGTINNDVDLASTSGDASVTNNGTAGNATTGSADSVANVVNLINSMITSGQSFIGEINIYGNLDGNILLPYQLVDSLVGANAASGSTPPPETQTDSGTIVNDVDQSINNQLTTDATSGNASVTDNGTAGNATTGSATTNVNIYNLTGSQVIGSNVLLVFINVLGTWVGLLMNAPAGTTAATLGGGVTQDTSLPTTPTGEIANNTTETINNNITVAATSGNATVSNNYTAGNATTGNASASINLANILGSDFSLSGWFGILIINVFGTWDGNLGVTTPPATPTVNSDPVTPSSDPTISNITPVNKTKTGVVLAAAFTNPSYSLASDTVATTNTQGSVLGLTTSKSSNTQSPKTTNASVVNHGSYSFIIAMIGILAGGLLLTIERILTVRRRGQGQV